MSTSGRFRRLFAAVILVAVSIGAGGAFGAQASGYPIGGVLPLRSVSSGGLGAPVVATGPIAAQSAASSPSASAQLKCSPAPCALPNVQASGAKQFTSTVFSAPIAVNPKDNRQLLVGGHDETCLHHQGFYTSSNGGTTWTHTCLSSLPGSRGYENSVVVGYDLKGTAYIGGIDVGGADGSDIVFEKSTDNGKTWSAPAIAVKPFTAGGFTDFPWLQIDTNKGSPHANTLYVSDAQLGPSGSQITVSHSSDGGTTWTTTAVDPIQVFPVTEDSFSDIAIGKDGTVYVSWMRCTSHPTAFDCGGTTATMEMSRSTDGGNSWSAPVTIASVVLAPDCLANLYLGFFGCLPNTIEPVMNVPAIGIDNSTGRNAGHLYAVMYTWTGAYMKVQVASSSDGGATWGAPVAVAPPTVTHDQFFPWLSVSSTGVVGVTWLDRRNDPANHDYEAFGTYSTNGGTSFATNIQLATVASNPNNDGWSGYNMGYYTGNAWAGDTLYAAWMDTRNGFDSQDWVGGFRVRQ